MANSCGSLSKGCWGFLDSFRVAKHRPKPGLGFSLREQVVSSSSDVGTANLSRGKGFPHKRKGVTRSASKTRVEMIAVDTKPRETEPREMKLRESKREETAETASEQPSDEGFRTAVQEMSKPLADATSISSSASNSPKPSSSPDSDTSASSRTFAGRRDNRVGGNFRTRISDAGQSYAQIWTRFPDTANEERRQSSRGASSSAPNTPPWRRDGAVRKPSRTVVDRWVSESDDEEEDHRGVSNSPQNTPPVRRDGAVRKSSRTVVDRWVSESDDEEEDLGGPSSSARNTPPLRRDGAVRRSSRTVVDRWVSDSDDEEDYPSRRPSRYEKLDRSLKSEVAKLERGKVSAERSGKWKRREPKNGTGGGARERQVAPPRPSVQRFVHTELLAIVRRRRELERQRKGESEKEKLSEGGIERALSDGGEELGAGEKSVAASDASEKDDQLVGQTEGQNNGQDKGHGNGQVRLTPDLLELADRLEQLVEGDASAVEDGGQPAVGDFERKEGPQSAEVEVEGEKAPIEPRGKKWEKALESRAQRALTRRVTELAKRRQLDEIFETIERARKRGLVPNRKLSNAVMSACARCADLDRAREVFNDMVCEGGPGVNEVTYGALLKALGAAGRVDEALRLLNLMGLPNAPGSPQVTDIHVITVLNACADAGDSLRARTLLEERAGRSTLAYNLLIKAHAKSGTPLGALLVVDEMRAHGLALDRNTYNSLILACVNGDNMRRAWELVNEMKSRSKFLQNLQLAPDVITYSTLLRGVARPGALGAVLHVAEEMHTCPTCSFDRIAYGALVDACIRCGSPDTAESVLAEMEERGREDPKLRPGPYAFLSLMRAFALEGELERCQELREGLCSSRCGGWASVKERQEADELCLEAAVSSGYTGPAKRLLRTMKAVKEGRALSQRATSALVRLYASEVLYAGDSLRLQPLKFREDASLAARVDTRSLPLIPELMFVTEDADPEEVAARLEATPVVLVVRDRVEGEGVAFLGYVSKSDLRGGDPPISDVMRTLPPPIAADDPISHAASLLLRNSSEVLLLVESEPSDPETLAQVVGIVTRGQLFEEVAVASASAGASGYHSDDDPGLEMIKQDLRKRGGAPGPGNPEEVPSEARTFSQSGPVFPWKTRLARLFELGRETQVEESGSEEELVTETEVMVEDNAGLEMIRQDMLRLEGGPLIKAKKKAGPKQEQHSRRALAKLAYMEGLELDADELYENGKDAG